MIVLCYLVPLPHLTKGSLFVFTTASVAAVKRLSTPYSTIIVNLYLLVLCDY